MRGWISSGWLSSLSGVRSRAFFYTALGMLWTLPFWTHPFACPFGLHDWAYPCLPSQHTAYLHSLTAPWWDTDLGLPHALPQITLPWMLLGALVAISPSIGLRLFLLAAFVASAIAADVAADRLFGAHDRWARFIAGMLYAASPFLSTKLASGHLGFLACAPLLPATLVALDASAGKAGVRAWAASAICAASAFAQLQIGMILLALLPVIGWGKVAARNWLATWAIAVITFAPIAFAAMVAYRGGVFAPETQLAAWLADKSVPWQHAIDGTSYFAAYFQDSVSSAALRAWIGVAPMCFIAALLRAGAPRRLAVVAIALGALATGTAGPLSAIVTTVFARVPAASVFREFYDLLFVAPLVVAGGAAIVVNALSMWRPRNDLPRRAALAACGIASAVLISPAAFADLAALVPMVDLRSPQLDRGDDRIMWLPATPPVGPRGSPGGADPFQVPVDGHPAASAFHPTGLLAYAGALADRGYPLDRTLLERLDVAAVVVRPGIVSDRLSSAAHAQAAPVARTAPVSSATGVASVIAIAAGRPACEPDLRSVLARDAAAYTRCDVAWSIVPREDIATSQDDPDAGWVDGERWALIDPALAQPRWPVLFTRSRTPYTWTQPARGVTWIYAPGGAALDGYFLEPADSWRAVATHDGRHSLHGSGGGLVAISATLPSARVATSNGPPEIPIRATTSDRYAGAFDATVKPHGPATLVLREGWSNGWRASIDGRDLGGPGFVDGFAAGWVVEGAAETTHLSIRYAPATPYFALLALSWLTLAATVFVFARRPNR